MMLLRMAALLLLVAAPLRAQPLQEDSGKLAVQIAGQSYALTAFTARPVAGTRFPVALIVHGSASPAGDTPGLSLVASRQWARSLATRGWLAVVVARRGYAGSEGVATIGNGTCAEPGAGDYLDSHADDEAAALQAIGKRDDADMDRVLLVGKSVGGAVALDLAARSGVKVAAVVNVSGGVSAFTEPLSVNPSCPLYAADLVWNLARFGQKSRMPTLWLYAENDTWFSPALVGRMHTAYTAAGGKAELHMLPAFAPNGHDLYEQYAGQEQLWPLIDSFLRTHGLPTWDEGLAAPLLAAMKPVQRGLAMQYLAQVPAMKALAVADGEATAAGWGSDRDTLQGAIDRAMKLCTDTAKAGCHLVMVNYAPPVAAAPQTR